MIHLSHPYMTTGKIIALTRQTFVGEVISLLFNMLSRFVIGFLPRSKSLLISWLQSPSAVILEPKKIKSVTVFIFLPYICHEVMELDAIILVFWMLSFKPAFALSSLIFFKRFYSAYLRLLMFCLAILIPIQLVGNKYHIWIIRLLIQIKSLLWPRTTSCTRIYSLFFNLSFLCLG